MRSSIIAALPFALSLASFASAVPVTVTPQDANSFVVNDQLAFELVGQAITLNGEQEDVGEDAMAQNWGGLAAGRAAFKMMAEPAIESANIQRRSVIKNPKYIINPKWSGEATASSSAAPEEPSTTTDYTTTYTTTYTTVTVTVDGQPTVTTIPSNAVTSAPSVAPTTTKTKKTKTKTTTTTTAKTAASSSTSKTYTGQATYYYQNGNPGACGNYYSDSDYIVAMDTDMYGDENAVSKYCGKSITITNTDNGKSVTATIQDACPTCASSGSMDLSVAAFEAIGDLDTGVLPISWHFN